MIQIALKKNGFLQVPHLTEENSSAMATSNNNNNTMSAPTAEVKIVNGSWNPEQKDRYSPNQVVAKSGTIITWINEDSFLHTVTSDKTGLFDSSIVSANQ
jgi:plastocyanin